MGGDTQESGSSPGSEEIRTQDELFVAVYQELRTIAHSRLRQHQRGTVLDTTALVNETYLKLAGHEKTPHFTSRLHFVATAALAMRQILTDQARRRMAEKRGGNQRNLTLNEDDIAVQDPSMEVLALDAAMHELSELDPALVEIVNLKYFGGLNVDEIAELQGVSKRTISRAWQKARAFLHARVVE